MVDPSIKETRSALELLLVETEQEIARLLQVAIQTKTSINRHSLISSLPPEILSEIFILCCQPNYNAIGGVASQGISPLRLSAVCKAWRELAWTTSHLWSVIILINPNPRALHLEEILASWITRAGNQPLSIRYDVNGNGLLERFIRFQDTKKWKNVSIFLPSESVSVFKKSFFFPLLEHFSIRVRGSLGSNMGGLEDFDIFNSLSLPNITRLHVPKYLRCFKPNSMWLQLKTFSASTIGHEQLCNILRFAEFLEVFNANSLEPHTEGNIPETVNHSYLRRLVLKEVDSGTLNLLLSTPGISTPNLEDLTIEISYGSPDSTSLSNFVTSLHQLRRFKVKYDNHHDPQWGFHWLLNIPSLTELNVETSTEAITNIVSALGNPASTETKIEYLPLLDDLMITFGYYGDGNLVMKDIPEMLAYRSSGLSPSMSRLKHASLKSASFSEEELEAFRMASLGDLALTVVDWHGLSTNIIGRNLPDLSEA